MHYFILGSSTNLAPFIEFHISFTCCHLTLMNPIRQYPWSLQMVPSAINATDSLWTNIFCRLHRQGAFALFFLHVSQVFFRVLLSSVIMLQVLVSSMHTRMCSCNRACPLILDNMHTSVNIDIAIIISKLFFGGLQLRLVPPGQVSHIISPSGTDPLR